MSGRMTVESGFMKYEVVNPSDSCYVYSDDPRIAAVAVAVASRGEYGLMSESGKSVLPILIFSDFGEWLASVGIDPDGLLHFIEENAAKIAEVLCSVTYRGGCRTSTNNISRAFEECADQILERQKVPRSIVKCPRCGCDDHIRSYYERKSQHTYVTGVCEQCELRYAQYDGEMVWDRFHPEGEANYGPL